MALRAGIVRWALVFGPVAAFTLAIVGTVFAVRRSTRRRQAVFALVFTSLVMVWFAAQRVVSVATYGTI